MCHLQVVELLLEGETTETTVTGTEEESGTQTPGGTTVHLLRLNPLRCLTKTAPNGPADGGPRRNDDDDAYRARTARVKEADKTELLKFPQGTAWRTWRAHAIHAIVSAAGRQGDMAQAWIMKVETQDLTYLQEPGVGWVSLDRTLAAALARISEGEIGRQLTLASTTALSSNTVQRGRVLLTIAFRYHAVWGQRACLE